MIICPTCGAHNDPGNRFCDQCGTRLENVTPVPEAAPTPPATPTTQATPPTTATLNCPNCGASVLLGQAFCDECGYPLNATYSEYTASDAPTMLAPSEEMAIEQEVAEAAAPDSMAVGSPEPAPAPAPIASPEPATTTVVPETETPPEEALGPAPVSTITPESPTAPTAESEPAPEPVIAAEPQPVETIEEHPSPPETPAAAPETGPTASPERQRLEGLIAAHRDTITQYEQMLTRYPAGAAPTFLNAGRDEARRALAQAEADLAALSTGPDPAEVARLEELIAAHRDTIAQYEQMLARYPAGAAPTFLNAGLDEARHALAQAEADLAALHGQALPTTAAPEAVAPVPTPGTEAPAAEAALPAEPAPESTPAPPTAAPAPAVGPSAGPRLVLAEGGQELKLPSDKTEIIIGREDPVSQIFPEIDLTPYGGESGGVSRQHARISQSNGQWTVSDLNSTNYTRVDGNRIEPNTPTPIHDGSRIQFGRIATVFHL